MKEPSTGKGGIPSETLGPHKIGPLARLFPRHSDETYEALKQDIALHRLTAGRLLAGGARRRCSGDSGRSNGCSWQPLRPPNRNPAEFLGCPSLLPLQFILEATGFPPFGKGLTGVSALPVAAPERTPACSLCKEAIGRAEGKCTPLTTYH